MFCLSFCCCSTSFPTAYTFYFSNFLQLWEDGAVQSERAELLSGCAIGMPGVFSRNFKVN